MKSETYAYSNGVTNFLGYLARPDTGENVPGVLVVHAAPGLGDHAKLQAERLAGLGYAALAVDLYGNGEIGVGFEAAVALLRSLQADPAVHRQRLRHGLETLAGLPDVDAERLAAIGYCSGGMGVLELARSGAPVAGVVSFHGLLETPMEAAPGAIESQILVCAGSADPMVPPTQIQAFAEEMSRAKADWQIITYGGAGHAFTDRAVDDLGLPGFGYDERADRRSWLAMRAFLAEIFG